MSPNKEKPHVLVLPEDDANSRLATGFHLEVDSTRFRQMQVLPAAGGWNEVLRRFTKDEVDGMDKWRSRFMVLLIDFDGKEDRLETAKAEIPDRLTERVFILGTLTEPEDLRKANLGPYEKIGSKLAEDCREETDTIWKHNLLRHNASELDRLRKHVRPILFQFI
jgi:hypothetical protein